MTDEQIQEEQIQEDSASTTANEKSQGEHDLKEALKKIKETVSEEDPKPSSWWRPADFGDGAFTNLAVRTDCGLLNGLCSLPLSMSARHANH